MAGWRSAKARLVSCSSPGRMPPVSRGRRTTVASSFGANALRTDIPALVRMPLVQHRSFTTIGAPWSGSRITSRRVPASGRRVCSSASSGSTKAKLNSSRSSAAKKARFIPLYGAKSAGQALICVEYARSGGTHPTLECWQGSAMVEIPGSNLRYFPSTIKPMGSDIGNAAGRRSPRIRESCRLDAPTAAHPHMGLGPFRRRLFRSVEILGGQSR